MEPHALPKIVLASGSPRRVDLLTQYLDDIFGEAVVAFAIDPADLDETPLQGETPLAHVQRLANAKAQMVAQRHVGADTVVIAGDTTVDVAGAIFGKPVDDAEARSMLQQLSGRTHHVHTALAVIRGDRMAHVVDSAAVTMTHITDEQLNWYLATGEHADKAGAYALQGQGGALVDKVVGSLTTVIGLPLDALAEALSACGCGWKIGQ
jgi:septum formation protein